MFFSGSLQDGIALAVQQQKAVICFVRDNEETSTQWEEQYFKDDEFARVLAEKSVLLRLAKDAPETGFLTSFCPVTKYPTVVVILNGMLREYIVPETSKEDFQRRLRDVLEDRKDATAAGTESPQAQGQAQAQTPQAQPSIGTSTGAAAAPVSTDTSAPTPVHAPAPAGNPPSSSSQSEAQNTETRNQSGQPQSENIRLGDRSFNVARTNNAQKPTPKPAQRKAEQKPEQKPQKPQKEKEVKPTPESSGPSTADQKPKPPRGPPKEYRLQVRLFDGSSVRSSFLPSHTIRANVRPWLDGQMAEEKRPYNLKHIMTPLPNRTLSIADEEQSLEALSLGPTANLVMVPINTYTEAYSSSASLPVRAVSTAYGLVSSTVGAAAGLVGSFLGYGQTAPAPSQSGPNSSASSQTGSSPAGPRPTGTRIRTLRDQRDEEGDKQFYNGNQLNFEPRKDDDR